MKIRTDFVTNSSSSSFVTINIKTKDRNFTLKEDEFIGCIELENNMDNEALAFVIRCAFGYNDYLSKDAVALIENIKKIDMRTVEFIELQEVYDDNESEDDGRTVYKHFYSGITGQWYDTKKELNCEEKKFFSEKEKYRNVELVGTGKDGRAPNHEYMSVGDSVELVREPDNPFDANAVLVKGKGRGLGHLSAYLAKNISWKLDTGKFIVDNAKVSSTTPLSQRSKSAKNPIMEIDFDIIPVDSETKMDSQKNIAKSVQQKKSTSAKEKSKNGSKPSDKNKQLSIEQIKESVLTEVFETIVDEFDESDDVKQSVKEHFYDNYHGCLFLWLFFRCGVNEVELEAQEITDIIRSEEFRSVLGITMIEIEIVTQIEFLVNELLESEDEDDVAKTLLSSALMTAVAEKELYIEFANNLEKVFSELSTSMDAMRNQLDEFEQLIQETVSDILDATDEEDDDVAEDEDDFDYAATEQAEAEIVDQLEDIKKDMNSIGEQLQAMAEEAKQREQAEIDEATKRGKYIPIEFKSNNIFPEGFAELLEQGKPYPKYYEHNFEIFVRRIKEIIPVDISDVPEDVLHEYDDRYTIENVEYHAQRIVELWNKYLLSLKGVETDFYVWQIEKCGIGYCDDIDKLIFELDDKFWLNGFVSEDEDFEFDKGILKKYKGKASNIVLPEGIIQFTSSKFYNANKDISNVTSFTFPRTLKKFDTQSETPFPKMRNLTRVDVSADNEVFSSVNGVLLNKAGTELLYYPIAKRDKEYTLPKTVIKVLPNVFTKNRYVEKIIVPGNVVEIGEGAFSNCINLKSVIFENGVKTIAKNAFKGCSSLEEIFIPESMEKFLMTSFQKCEALKVIYVPEGSKVMVNAEKMAMKFGAELVKYKAGETVEDVMKKAKSINATPTIHVAINTAENNVTSAQIVKQSVEVKAKPIATQEIEGNINNDLVLKDKANKRIKELEEQIKSNNDISTFGSMIIVGGLLLAAFFLYCVIDEYNAYQVSSAFYNYVSTDSITISLVLLAISLIIIVFGFVKKCKGKKAKKINSQLQNEINILKDPKNHKLYFENEEKAIKAKENKKY